MNYVLMDLEWNQPRPEDEKVLVPFPFDSDLIEFGAVKLDDHFQMISEYCSYVKPQHYKFMNTRVSSLTKIKTKVLESAKTFPEAYADFLDWCGDDFAFMSWSTSDLTVLMDNMIIYGVSTADFPSAYDLQRIFAHEISRDEKQWALEDAVKMLNLPTERAHDALNDAKMTARIASFMDLEEYLDEYELIYYDYEGERKACEIPERTFSSLNEAAENEDLITFVCPYCGEKMKAEDMLLLAPGKKGGCLRCSEGDEFLLELKAFRISNNRSKILRTIRLMNDDMWDCYQDALEQRNNG